MTDKFGRATGGSNVSSVNTGVTKGYIRANYLESNMEEDIDLKNQFKIINVPYPISLKDVANKEYVDDNIEQASVVRNNIDNNFNNNKLTNISSIEINNNPILDDEVANKNYVDLTVDENSLLRNNKPISVSSIQITNDPISNQDATNKQYVDQTVDNGSIIRNTQNNNFANVKLFNIKSIQINDEPINPLEVCHKQYVDSKIIPGINQDSTKDVEETDDIIYLLINTLSGVTSFPIATKDYVDKRVFNEFQVITTFTNNTGVDLWVNWSLEVLSGMTSVAGFFKSASNTSTSSVGTGPNSNPPIGSWYSFTETSTPNNGVDRYAIATYNQHTNITKVSFYYNRTGTTMCRFRIQYQNLSNEWIDKLVFDNNSNITGGDVWQFLDVSFLEDNLGIRFYFDQITGYESDMAFSDITINYYAPKYT